LYKGKKSFYLSKNNYKFSQYNYKQAIHLKKNNLKEKMYYSAFSMVLSRTYKFQHERYNWKSIPSGKFMIGIILNIDYPKQTYQLMDRKIFQ